MVQTAENKSRLYYRTQLLDGKEPLAKTAENATLLEQVRAELAADVAAGRKSVQGATSAATAQPLQLPADKRNGKRKPAASQGTQRPLKRTHSMEEDGNQARRRIRGKSKIRIVKKERSGDAAEAGVQQTAASSRQATDVADDSSEEESASSRQATDTRDKVGFGFGSWATDARARLVMHDLGSWLAEQDGDIRAELWDSLPLSVVTWLFECGYESHATAKATYDLDEVREYVKNLKRLKPAERRDGETSLGSLGSPGH